MTVKSPRATLKHRHLTGNELLSEKKSLVSWERNNLLLERQQDWGRYHYYNNVSRKKKKKKGKNYNLDFYGTSVVVSDVTVSAVTVPADVVVVDVVEHLFLLRP